MKKLVLILLIISSSLFITREALSLPNCSGTYSSSWNNCFGTYIYMYGEAIGDKYVGEFKNGDFDGQGTYTYSSSGQWAGNKYVGEWLNSQYNGQGTLTYPDGTIEEGRPKYWVGAHVYSFNKASLGVCMIGRNYFTEVQFISLKKVLNAWANEFPEASV